MCAAATLAQTRYAEHSLLSSGRWVKIRVASEGVYQLSRADLSAMGFGNPDRVRLYGYNVPMLPEAYIEDFDDDLTEIPVLRRGDGTMLFYSFGTTQWTFSDGSFSHTNNPYSTHVYYFLTEGPAAPKAMPKSGTTSAIRTLATVPAHALVEKDEFGYLNAGRTFFEAYDFSQGSTRTYTVPMPYIASTLVNLTIQHVAAGSSSSQLTVSSEGNTLVTLSFSPLADYQYGEVRSASVEWPNVVSDRPTLRFSHPCPTATTGHLDYIRATYRRRPCIGGEGYLAFCTDEPYAYSAAVTGANESTRVIRVTTPELTMEMHGSYANGTYNTVVTPTEDGGDTYVAINTNASFPVPEVVGDVANQDLHALSGFDLVIITPSNGILNAEAQRLADAHAAKDGMRCVVVQANQIYNEFSSGTPDITAYRRFLKMLYDKSGGKCPRNVLLFGRGVWDNKMISSTMKGQKPDDYLLCYESDNSVSHTDSYVMEEYITLLADGKGVFPLKEQPDCGVGRLPVSGSVQARSMVDKIIRYMQGGDYGAWLNTICFMADDGNANMHGEDAENVWTLTSSLYPDYRYRKIYWDSYSSEQSSTGTSYPDVYAEVNKLTNEGALIMNYTGHGAAYCLSHEQVLKTQDFQGWQSPRLPLWFTAACDIMPFDMNTTNLGVEAVLNANGGAIGFVGTARTVYSSQNRVLNRHFMRHVLGRKDNGDRYTIGEALAQAKGSIANASSSSYATALDLVNKVHFALIGDPAITLPVPEMKVKVDRINGRNVTSETSLTISAGARVTLEGHVENAEGQIDDTYSGLVTPTLLDCVQDITCKDNDGSAAANKPAKEPLTYQDRTSVLFSGTDSIRSGRFSITFPVPLDMSYANDNGLITLFAIDSSRSRTANGSYGDFLLGGTADDAFSDASGPEIHLYIDSPRFVDGGITSETPTIYATLYDDNGINHSGAGLGHDITAIIDNDEATTYALNAYYTSQTGDYRSGSLAFTTPPLSEGRHTLTLRAFDVFNNMSEATVTFEVIEGLTVETDIFDFAGRQMSGDMTTLPKGMYVRRIRQVTPYGTVVGERSEKVYVKQ